MQSPGTRCVLAVLALATLATAPATAQVLYGSLVGSVLDQSGAVVPAAQISLTNRQTGQARTGQTDAEGRYSILNILPGLYDVKAIAAGFRPVTQSGVAVSINAVARIDLHLEIGNLADAVTVSAAATTLQTDRADLRVELGSKAVTNLPLSNYRNYQSLINLVPGATPAAFQNAAMDTPARSLTTNVNGTNRNSNNTRVDGAANTFASLSSHTLIVPPAETIDAVNIATNALDAEQGMAGGVAVTVNTKSGTNEFHGVGFEYHDNQHLRARNFFLRTPGKPKSITNIMGATLGGPILKDRLFFFGSWEGFRGRSGQSGNFSVPTADLRTGDFSAYPVTLYDPATGTATGTGRTPFAGNRIPAGRQSAITRKILDPAPFPNLPGTLTNYANSGTQKLDRDNYDAKVNWNRSSRQTIWGKYSRMDAVVGCIFALGDAGGPGLCDNGVGTSDTTVQLATIGQTFTFSPRVLLDAVFGYSRLDQSVTSPDYGRNVGSDVWGIPGTNGKDPRYSGMPTIRTDFTDFGNSYNWMPVFRNDRSFTFTSNLSVTRGAHDLRTGFDLVRHQVNQWQPNLGGGPRGLIIFTGGATALNGGAAPNYFNSFGSFLLGLPNSMSRAEQVYLQTAREWQIGWYVRDRWQVSRRLTVNLGLRHEYFPMMTRDGQGVERWDPATNLVTVGGLGGNPNNAGITTSGKLFSPRVGTAYRLSDRMVIRSGYGINYDPLPMARPLRSLYPSTLETTFTAANTFSAYRPIDQGIPPIPIPDYKSGSVVLPANVSMGPRSAWRGELHRGYIQSWNLTVERRLPADFISSAAYVGMQTVHQFADININAAGPGAGQAGRPLYARLGRTIDTNMFDGWLSANYHAFQATLDRPMTRGLMLKTAYTFSKAISMTDDSGWTSVSWNWGPVIGRNRARTGYDRTHMLVAGFVYELPFGAGKSWARGGAAAKILGGWQVNGTFGAYTGVPFTVSASGTSLNAPGNAQTADQAKPAVQKLGRIGTSGPFYDPLAFRAITDVRFGTSGRNILDGPGMVNTDFSLMRSFAVTERIRLQFKAEAFNLTNTPHFSAPSANVSNMSLNTDGTIRSLGNFMTVTSAQTDERQLRFGLRVSF
jgi:hypothetical protein